MPQPPERKDADILETTSATNASTPDRLADSPSSETDAGVDDPLMGQISRDPDIDPGLAPSLSNNLDEDLPSPAIPEIPLTDLDDMPDDEFIQAPEMSDMNIPGEVDIEALDEDALDDTDLPPDARLDQLEA